MAGFPIKVEVEVPCPSCGDDLRTGGPATRITCRACDHEAVLSPDQWRHRVEEAVLDGPDLSPGGRVEHDLTGGEISFARVPVECRACHAEIPDATVQAALAQRTCACPGCAAAIPIRAVPPDLAVAFPGISHLLGEEAGLSSFWVWHEPTRRRRGIARTSPLSWKGLHEIATDRDGNLYLLTEYDDDTVGCASLDERARTRWCRYGLPIGGDDVGLALTPDGAVLLWGKQRPSALRLSAADGKDLGTLGERQPAGADRHHLDLRDCTSLAVDSDGTLLLCKERRLVRCAPDGSGVVTWPPHTGFLGRTIKETLRPFSGRDDDAPDCSELKDHPRSVDGKISVGWDGNLYVHGDGVVVSFDRTGRRRYRAELPHSGWRAAVADAAGCAYVGADTHGVWRISATGTPALRIEGAHEHLAVAPDGTLFVAGPYAVLRVFGADGSLRHRSKEAIAADES